MRYGGYLVDETQSKTPLLLGCVSSLWHSCGLPTGTGYQIGHLPGSFGEYLLALRNLHSLTLCNVRVEHFKEKVFRTCFSTFRETLTCLSLNTFTTTPFSAFVTLVNYFPNITTLQLGSPELEPHGGGPVPSLSRPLQGKLNIRSLHGVRAECLRFFDRFAMLDLEYEELVIDSPSFIVETKFVESALQISTS